MLETVGRDWVVERIEGVRTLSNAYSISGNIHAMSRGLRDRAAREGWAGVDGPLDVAGRLIDAARDEASFGRGRRARAAELLAPRQGRIDIGDLMAVLRDHGAEAESDPDWSPRKTLPPNHLHARGARGAPQPDRGLHGLRPHRPARGALGDGDRRPLPQHLQAGGRRPTDPRARTEAHRPLRRPQPMVGSRNAFTALRCTTSPLLHARISEERDTLEAGFRLQMGRALAADHETLAQAVDACWSEAKGGRGGVGPKRCWA